MTTTIQEPLSSNDARVAILSRHEELRGLATETIHLSEGAARSAEEFEPFFTHARELYRAFEDLLDFEERVLADALRDVTGLGSVLRAQVLNGHEKQRATLASAKSALAPGDLSPAGLVENVRTAADVLLHELKHEERCLMTADLDALAADTRGG